jgi:hypothetical protein
LLVPQENTKLNVHIKRKMSAASEPTEPVASAQTESAIEPVEPEQEPAPAIEPVPAESTVEPVQELDNAGGSFTLVKRRGRPPGAKNKSKPPPSVVKVVEPPVVTAIAPAQTKSAIDRAEAEVPKEVPETKLFTQHQVEQILLNSFKLQEQKTRDEKRERYAALFRKQKWTVR